MDLDQFLSLSESEVSEIVRSEGPRVVVFPINGTRRWFLLENLRAGSDSKAGAEGGFLDLILDKYIELFDLFFAHGVSTLLSPILGPDIMGRGNEYDRMIHAALQEITSGERFADFYHRMDIRVRFYGDFDPFLKEKAPEIPAAIDRIQTETRDHLQHKLFWGMFAGDPVGAILRVFRDHPPNEDQVPQRADIVTHYYGEYIPPADMFIGMMPPRVFDFPLLDSGNTSLYFTTSPSPYFNKTMLRRILYDFCFCRPEDEDYSNLTPQELSDLESYTREHEQDVTGIGRLSSNRRFWHPI